MCGAPNQRGVHAHQNTHQSRSNTAVVVNKVLWMGSFFLRVCNSAFQQNLIIIWYLAYYFFFYRGVIINQKKSYRFTKWLVRLEEFYTKGIFHSWEGLNLSGDVGPCFKSESKVKLTWVCDYVILNSWYLNHHASNLKTVCSVHESTWTRKLAKNCFTVKYLFNYLIIT